MVSALILKLVILEKCVPSGATIHFITDLALDTFIADTVGLALSILWNFTFNRKFTFKSANNVPIAMLLAFAFLRTVLSFSDMVHRRGGKVACKYRRLGVRNSAGNLYAYKLRIGIYLAEIRSIPQPQKGRRSYGAIRAAFRRIGVGRNCRRKYGYRVA